MGLLPCAQAQPPAAAAPAATEVEWSFKALGAYGPLELRGVDGQSGVNVGIRLDQVVTRAKLKLRYQYSPALLEDLSHLKLVLNGETLGTVALPKAKAGVDNEADIDIDPRYFSDYNRLDIHLIGHYTLQCEDALHSSLWASISERSSLQLTLRELRLDNDLALLPAPLFDRRDNRRLELPFVFATMPDRAMLHAAGVLASWFGAQAGYRGARFALALGELPLRHAVVFAVNGAAPAGLQLGAVEQPTLSLIDHPQDPAVKLLVLQGKDAAQLELAAQALALGQVALSGSRATVTKVETVPRRAAYDAPNWVRTDRVVQFGELVDSPAQLQAIGHAPPPLRINLRLPPDLLTWDRLGVPIDLRYRYTPPVQQDNSMLSVAINDQFIQAFRLRPSGKTSQGRLLLPLLDNGQAQLKDEVLIPAFQVGSNNQLQFQFVTDLHKEGLCKDNASDQLRAAIDPDSTLDLTAFPHYAELPDLALFANAGFPFTKYADLAETVVVLPDAPQAAEVESLLFLLGRMGRMTGVPALRFELANAAEAQQVKDRDLLLIGADGAGLLAQWGQSLPVLIERTRRSLAPALSLPGLPRGWIDTRDDVARQWRVEFDAPGPLAALMGFESPLQGGRSVVAVTGNAPAAVADAVATLGDEARVGAIHGDVVFVRGALLDSFRIGDTYHVGHLPWWLALRYFLSQHPLLLALAGIFSVLFIALLAFWSLKRIAARRLDP